MNTYYEIHGSIDGSTEILFGSFAKSDVRYELDAEKDSWKDQGYTALAIIPRETDEKPDPEVYADDLCEICGAVDELSHNDETGLALCLKCDNENQPTDSITVEDREELRELEAEADQIHFFATCAIGWASAATRDEAIRKLVNANFSFFKDSIKPAQKRGDAGAYIWACQVNAPSDAKYGIEFYQPKGVEIEQGAEHFVTHLTRKNLAYTNSGK